MAAEVRVAVTKAKVIKAALAWATVTVAVVAVVREAAAMVLAASSELLLLPLVLSAVSLSSQRRDGRGQARLGVLTRVQSKSKGCARR